MKHFPGQIFAAIHDQNKNEYVRHFPSYNESKFRKLNEGGFGIYFSINSFNEGRGKENLIRLNAVYADIDIAKNDDGTSAEKREELKQQMISDLYSHCEPSMTIVTKNGIQPLWYIDEDSISAETVTRYKNVIQGIIQFSIEKGGLGDDVKDVSRVLRLPTYLHQKSDPYEVIELKGNNHVWALTDLALYFPFTKEIASPTPLEYPHDPQWNKLNDIPIELVAQRLGPATGHDISVGPDRNLIVDGERRGTFIGSDGNFIATSSSVYTHQGTPVTYTASVLGCSIQEAKEWLCKEFGVQSEKETLTLTYKDYLRMIKDLPETAESYVDALEPILRALAHETEARAYEVLSGPVKEHFSLTERKLTTLTKLLKKYRKDISQRQFDELKAEEVSQQEETYTDKEIREAQKLLRSPTLLYEMLTLVKRIGVVGEEKNVMTHYLALTSRHLDPPVSVVVKGDSSAGKSFTLGKVLKLFPRSAYIELTDATPQSLYYMPEDAFKHRFIVLFEKHGGEKADYAIRSLQSEGKLIIQYPRKNPDTNEFETVSVERDGPTGFITTTTDALIHSENETRNISIFPDQSDAQTRRIYEATESKYLQHERPDESELKIWRCAQTLIKPCRVRIEFAPKLKEFFPSDILRTRRDYGKFLSVIEASAFLHQMQRETFEEEDVIFVTAELADYEIARVVIEENLSKTIYELPEQTIQLLHAARILYEGSDGQGDKEKYVTTSMLRKDLNWNGDTVRKWLEPAVRSGYMNLLPNKEKNAKKYDVDLDKSMPGEELLPQYTILQLADPTLKLTKVYDPLSGEIWSPTTDKTDVEIEGESHDIPF
jgi:hypothetical protein